GGYERVATDIKRLGTTLDGLEAGHDVLGSPDFRCGDLEPECLGNCLHLTHLQHRGGIANIGHDRQSAETGDNLAQELDSLADKIDKLDRQAGDIATRSRQTSDKAAAHRVVYKREDDWDDR